MDKPSVRVVRRDQLASDTPQTSGLLRHVAFDSRNPDAMALSAFLTTVQPGAATGAHHHGDQETILYVLEGTARYRWGDRLEHVVESGPGRTRRSRARNGVRPWRRPVPAGGWPPFRRRARRSSWGSSDLGR
jgi:redox-sensitive bicupin YhaK (pirin superfamily)